jgi:hypothetical protein
VAPLPFSVYGASFEPPIAFQQASDYSRPHRSPLRDDAGTVFRSLQTGAGNFFDFELRILSF